MKTNQASIEDILLDILGCPSGFPGISIRIRRDGLIVVSDVQANYVGYAENFKDALINFMIDLISRARFPEQFGWYGEIDWADTYRQHVRSQKRGQEQGQSSEPLPDDHNDI